MPGLLPQPPRPLQSPHHDRNLYLDCGDYMMNAVSSLDGGFFGSRDRVWCYSSSTPTSSPGPDSQ